jgi:hypothetical protein
MPSVASKLPLVVARQYCSSPAVRGRYRPTRHRSLRRIQRTQTNPGVSASLEYVVPETAAGPGFLAKALSFRGGPAP